MVHPIVLRPVESGKYIAKNATHVTIIQEGLDKLTHKLASSIQNGKLVIPETSGEDIHPTVDQPKAVDWVFLVDALNFCFWSLTDSEHWIVNGHAGYFALEAALLRAIKENIDITNPKYYANITEQELRHVLRSDTSAEIPLFEDRLAILHDIGNTLLEKYDGTFKNCVKLANKSASKLIDLVIEDFPCFKDESEYKGKVVSLYKRVQILVSDLQFFCGEILGFDDIDTLTMFADYRVPQVLMYFGALKYSDELMEKLRNETLLPNGCEEEIEIRGCSIHAVELVKHQVASALADSDPPVKCPNSAQIDYYLWCYRRKHARKLEGIPYHKTLSIFY